MRDRRARNAVGFVRADDRADPIHAGCRRHNGFFNKEESDALLAAARDDEERLQLLFALADAHDTDLEVRPSP
jgi:hypothetical protein